MGDFIFDIYSFVEGPLLWFVFLTLLIGLIIRIVFNIYVLVKGYKDPKHFSFKDILNNFGRNLLPFHKLFVQKPLYVALLYIFHICLIVVPIWLEGHIVLWEESSFGWFWTPLPEAWADSMTLIFLGIASILLIRRIIIADIRHNSTKTDYLFLVFTVLPFMTGYFLSHGSLDSIPFLANNMELIHVFSGEVAIVMAVVLFRTSRFDEQKCSVCGACTLDCPTGALQLEDKGELRVLRYSHYKCTCCMSCVKTCPEKALALKHKLGFKLFLQTAPEEKKKVELAICQKCGVTFMPEFQLDRVGSMITHDYIFICTRCRRNNYADTIRHLGL